MCSDSKQNMAPLWFKPFKHRIFNSFELLIIGIKLHDLQSFNVIDVFRYCLLTEDGFTINLNQYTFNCIYTFPMFFLISIFESYVKFSLSLHVWQVYRLWQMACSLQILSASFQKNKRLRRFLISFYHKSILESI